MISLGISFYQLPEDASFLYTIAEKPFRSLTEINRIDAEIDQLVYELYGLTEGEIRIVEEN